ncbi:MAG: GNAT family N-acetyltransferase [candidate division WOR-3 bacterium]|nr:MAG: GNAT family N-acetyltransferase [candidate division WOR-3 bacterium]
MNDVRIRYAVTEDKVRIERLLEEAQLPFVDIKEHLDDFLVAECKNVIVGAVGIEIYGEVALLRSLVVAPSFKNCGVGRTLYEGIVAYAHLNGVRELFLLTTTASQLFKKLGFHKVVRSELPKLIQETNEFKSLCPASAVCMVKRIDGEAFHVPREVLRLQKSVPGATMWAVALETAMFTYFDIAPNSRFKMHKHESEQITYVIEGRLDFEIGDKSVSVGPGDIIAIPSNVPHAASAGNEHVRAVDAWSPVRKDFIHKK